MKKIIAVLGILLCMVLLPACGRENQESIAVGEKAEQETVEKTAEKAMGETVTEQTETVKKPLVVYFSQSGNTEQIAYDIQELTGADLFRITTVEGYPIWGGTCPMAVFSFLEQHDFTGKTVIPFCTHGGSGFSGSISDIEEILPETVPLLEGFSVYGTGAKEAHQDVENWLKEMNYKYAETSTPTEGERILVAYFSWADNAVIEGEVDAVASPSVTAPGNVAQLASWVSERTGGNLFSIQVTEPYSSDWDECLEWANQERSENARPELKESVENIEDYDVVFLGFPNWWYGSPMAVLSFLEENDLSGKQIYLFCSHGTGGLAGTVDDIKEILPENAVLSENVFDVNEEDTASSENDITGWLEELGF